MKLIQIKRRMQSSYLHGGLLGFVVCFFLVSASLAQTAGTGIAFVSNRSGGAEIFLINPNGKHVRQLTDQRLDDTEPALSPNGKQIAFVSFRHLKEIPEEIGILPGEIYVMNADGSNPINLTQSPERAEGISSWSPDGKQIAFTSGELFNDEILTNSDIWVMDADGANPINLTNHEAQDQTPDWSPDGLRIAFSSNRAGNWEIYVMNADGTNPINLTNHPSKDGRPDWSPDGNQIAFTSDREGNFELYVMNADGTNPINLTNHPAEDNNASWSPDGTRIAFDSNRDLVPDRDYNFEIYVMNADGTNPINLTQNRAWDAYPSWGPAPVLSVASKGKLATVWGKVKRSNTYGVR